MSFANRDALSSTVNHSDHELDGAKVGFKHELIVTHGTDATFCTENTCLSSHL